MILTVAEAGPLKTAIQSVLTTTGDEMRTARADGFGRALLRQCPVCCGQGLIESERAVPVRIPAAYRVPRYLRPFLCIGGVEASRLPQGVMIRSLPVVETSVAEDR